MRIQDYKFEGIDTDLPEGMVCAYRYGNGDLIVADIEEPLTTQLSDANLNEDGMGVAKIMQMQFNCHYLLLVWHESEEIRVVAFSDQKKVRALEFLDYVISDFGLVRGDAFCASGRVSAAILKVQMSGIDVLDPMEYFFVMSHAYFDKCIWIEAKEYGQAHKEEILRMPRYEKRRIAWAYVLTTDIVPKGQKLKMKSLENESGLEIIADDNIYIMIGCRGEVYDIKKEKFERTYDKTQEPLDVFEQMLDFLPEVQLAEDDTYISIDELAKICYPKAGQYIYAMRLENRTKVFPADESQEYYLGRQGDYMAVRPDDINDIYIIQEDIFNQTYEIV